MTDKTEEELLEEVEKALMGPPLPPPLTREALKSVFDLLDKQSMKVDTIIMHQADLDDIMKWGKNQKRKKKRKK